MLGHYIPPRDFEPVVKEFVKPVSDDYFIWWLFKHKCIVCKRPATEINEIVGKGRTKFAVKDWRNRVTLCRTCHGIYHAYGVNKEKMNIMQDARKEFLIAIGRQEYV